MAKKATFVTPVGIARYPYLSTPDSTGKFADGKYKTKLVVNKKEAKPFIDNIKTMAKALGVSKLPFAEDPDDDTNIVITAKSKYKPLVFDTKNKEVKGEVTISGGSKIRLGGVFFNYDTGISLQLKHVQIIDLVSSSEDSMFDAVEGSFDADDIGEEPTFGEVTNDDDMDL